MDGLKAGRCGNYRRSAKKCGMLWGRGGFCDKREARSWRLLAELGDSLIFPYDNGRRTPREEGKKKEI